MDRAGKCQHVFSTGFKIRPLNGLIFNFRKHRVLGGGAQTLDYMKAVRLGGVFEGEGGGSSLPNGAMLFRPFLF